MPYIGGRRKKRRTHRRLPDDAAATIADKVPRSFVLRRGEVDSTVVHLLADLRQMMLPHTAAKLRDRKQNTLKDFVNVAGPLGVTHLIMLSQTVSNVMCRIARLARGPTLTFKVKGYSLGSDVRALARRPVDIADAFATAPLVVLHNFGSVAAQGTEPGVAGVSLADALRLTMVTFQNMFPAIDPSTVKLPECRRVVLLHYHKASGDILLRQYFIRAAPVGATKAIKKVIQTRLPDLGGVADIAEYVLGEGTAGGGVASDSEFEDDAAKVTLPQDFKGRGNVKAHQSAIKLFEIGPRMTLSLVKVEQDLCNGEVLYHSFVSKTAEDVAHQRAVVRQREQEKERRRSEQAENVARKATEKEAKKAAKMKRRQAKQALVVRAAASGTLGDFVSGGEDSEGPAGDEASVRKGTSRKGAPLAVTVERDSDDDDGGSSAIPENQPAIRAVGPNLKGITGKKRRRS